MDWVVAIKISSRSAIRHVESESVQIMAAANFDFDHFTAFRNINLLRGVPT
jgi:hypothetical protein